MNDLRIAVLNLPEYTASEISSAVKRALEGYVGCVGVPDEKSATTRTYPRSCARPLRSAVIRK